jgi:hypothetical protein
MSFFVRIFRERSLPHLGGTIGFKSLAQWSMPQPSSQQSPQEDLHHPPQLGREGQNSSHSTTQQLVLTVFISQTTLHRFCTPHRWQHS